MAKPLIRRLPGVTETHVMQARAPLTIGIQLLRAEWAAGPSECALQRDALSVSCRIRPLQTTLRGKGGFAGFLCIS